MITFSTLLAHVAATNPDRSRKYHVLATRYYLGVEGSASEFRRTMACPQHIFRDHVAPSYLSREDADYIIGAR